jgi:putative transposase
MTNYVRLLVTPQQANGIAKLIQSIGRQYVQYINTMHQRSGTVREVFYQGWFGGCGPVFFPTGCGISN